MSIMSECAWNYTSPTVLRSLCGVSGSLYRKRVFNTFLTTGAPRLAQMNLHVLDGSATGYAGTQNRTKSSAKYISGQTISALVSFWSRPITRLRSSNIGGSRLSGSNKLRPAQVIPERHSNDEPLYHLSTPSETGLIVRSARGR